MKISSRPRRRARENIVPLVNVVFLLLIFFLLAGSLRGPEAFEVDPPAAGSSTSAAPLMETLVLDRDGRLAFGDRVVEREALRDVFAQDGAAAGASRRLRIRADRHARADHLLPLLEALAQLGISEVALATRDGG